MGFGRRMAAGLSCPRPSSAGAVARAVLYPPSSGVGPSEGLAAGAELCWWVKSAPDLHRHLQPPSKKGGKEGFSKLRVAFSQLLNVMAV